MANLSKAETLIENAAEAEEIAAAEHDPDARRRWLEIAATWRSLAEREFAAAIGEGVTLH
jgi:hypothetical protein